MRKIIALMLSLALCLSLTAALAEQTITVTGSGETLVSADTAIVSVGVNVRKPTAPQAQSAANEVIAAIRAALTAAGFSEEDVNTGFINLYGVYDYTKDVEEIVAYNANSTLAVNVSDMARVGEVIDLAFGAGANTLDYVTFSVSDQTAARAESLKSAVADAQAKAAVLAEAAGLGELEIVSIQEGSVYSFDSGLNNFSRKVAGAETMDYATVVQAAKIGVSATVTITFKAK
jgi:uncharacterized protein YggE